MTTNEAILHNNYQGGKPTAISSPARQTYTLSPGIGTASVGTALPAKLRNIGRPVRTFDTQKQPTLVSR